MCNPQISFIIHFYRCQYFKQEIRQPTRPLTYYIPNLELTKKIANLYELLRTPRLLLTLPDAT